MKLATPIDEVNGLALYCFRPRATTTVTLKKDQITHVLFSHANGVSARTYTHLLQSWANKTGLTIYTYDVRGMGLSQRPTASAYANGKADVWRHLNRDLIEVLEHVSEREAPAVKREQWMLAGHSLGGWLSLLSSSRAGVKHILLLDMPMLPIHQSALWTLACVFGIRSMHPLAKVAKRRKRHYKSLDQVLKSFARTAFFKTWPDEKVRTYVEANFEHRKDKLNLLHDPIWEADIFEAMPANIFAAFNQLTKSARDKLEVVLVVGKDSEVCRPSWNRYVNWFFPRTRRLSIDGGHMFPFEHEAEFLELLPSLTPMHL